eukprot:jgi/Bigna1/143057/aug1.75_g17765
MKTLAKFAPSRGGIEGELLKEKRGAWKDSEVEREDRRRKDETEMERYQLEIKGEEFGNRLQGDSKINQLSSRTFREEYLARERELLKQKELEGAVHEKAASSAYDQYLEKKFGVIIPRVPLKGKGTAEYSASKVPKKTTSNKKKTAQTSRSNRSSSKSRKTAKKTVTTGLRKNSRGVPKGFTPTRTGNHFPGGYSQMAKGGSSNKSRRSTKSRRPIKTAGHKNIETYKALHRSPEIKSATTTVTSVSGKEPVGNSQEKLDIINGSVQAAMAEAMLALDEPIGH